MKTSHVTQVATFEKLLGYCNAQGAMYNPTKDSLKVTALNSLLTSARQSVEAVHDAHFLFGEAVYDRKETFSKLGKFMTPTIHALKATNAPNATIAEAYRYKKRFVHAVKSRPVQPPASTAANGDPPVAPEKTKSQQAFDNQLSNFETFVKVVTSEPSYAPHEADLSVAGLNAMVATLREKNKAVLDARIALATARKTRNKILYSQDSVREIAQAVKAYARSVFGTTSKVFREISGLRFFDIEGPKA